MRINIGRFAMRSPSGMGDPGIGFKIAFFKPGFQSGNLAGALLNYYLAILNKGNAGGIITSIFLALKSFY
jgi:hypothetical protein